MDIITAPGIYFDMSNEAYHTDCSLSNSGMGLLLNNPKKYWSQSPFNPKRAPLNTPALAQGTAMHTLLLEPEKFHDEWKIRPNVQSTKAKGMIGEGDYNDFKEAIAAIRNDDCLSQLFQHGYPEVSIFWVDEETKVPCRIRFDYLSELIASDLKSTVNACGNNLGYSIVDYGYYRQAAFYLEGVRQIKELIRRDMAVISGAHDPEWLLRFLDVVHETFVFLFQEKKAPYITRAVSLCQRTLEKGEAKYKEALRLYKYNFDTFGSSPWPSGYEGSIETLQLDDLPAKIDYI